MSQISPQTLVFDTVIPHLQTALEPSAMKKAFTKILANNTNDAIRFSLQSCEIERIKYKPGKNCMIYYSLHLQNNITGLQDSQLVCLRFYPAGDSASRFEKAKKATLVKPNIGEAIVHVPELGAVAWAFPNDRKLEHVSKLVNDTFLREELLPSVIASHVGQEWKITDLSHELVHYAPEHTCTARVQVRLRDIKGKARDLTLYGKTYYNDDGAETYRLMQLLYNAQTRKQGLLNTAKPLSYHPKYNMLWQQGLSGSALIDLDLGSPEFVRALKQVARTVATLHQTPLCCKRNVTLQDWEDKLTEVTAMVAEVKPELAEALGSIKNNLLLQSRSLGKQPKATLHGDLHLQNFLTDNGTISVIDLDNLCQGSPWQDIGSFIAVLYYRGALENIPFPVIEHLSKTFCEAYALASSWKLDEESVRWYTATALISERVFRTIARLKAGRLEILDDLLGVAKNLSQSTALVS